MIFCHFTFAQVPDFVKEMVENYLQIRQKPESDRLLQEYLSPLNAGEIHCMPYSTARRIVRDVKLPFRTSIKC